MLRARPLFCKSKLVCKFIDEYVKNRWVPQDGRSHLEW